MSLRRRMVLLTGAAVALAVLLSAGACYLAVERSLSGRVNRQLETSAAVLTHLAHTNLLTDPRPRQPGTHGPLGSLADRIPGTSLQRTGEGAIFTQAGTIFRGPQDQTAYRLTARDLAVAARVKGAFFEDTHIGSTPVRVYVSSAGHGRAVVAVQSLSELDSTMNNLAPILAAIALAGIVLAGLFGFLVAGAAARPVHALRHATEHVGATGDLSRRIETVGSDDLGRLGESFNTMLGALEESQRTQQQLIGDASHELRTPIASLRINLEVLARNPEMAPGDRGPLLRDVIEQSAELGSLVDDLLESAREGDGESGSERLHLEQIVAAESARLAVPHPEVRLIQRLEPCEIVGQAARLRRAVSNILENAIKWSPAGGPVEVDLAGAQLRVRDHGPGFSEVDLPYVFDRFYRSARARAVPGAGLGLSIVRKVAREHHGSADASNAPDGGAIVTLDLRGSRVGGD